VQRESVSNQATKRLHDVWILTQKDIRLWHRRFLSTNSSKSLVRVTQVTVSGPRHGAGGGWWISARLRRHLRDVPSIGIGGNSGRLFQRHIERSWHGIHDSEVHFSGICMVPNGITNRSKESRLEIYPIASSPATWKVASYIGKVFCPISNVICIRSLSRTAVLIPYWINHCHLLSSPRLEGGDRASANFTGCSKCRPSQSACGLYLKLRSVLSVTRSSAYWLQPKSHVQVFRPGRKTWSCLKLKIWCPRRSRPLKRRSRASGGRMYAMTKTR